MFTVEIKINGSLIAHVYGYNKSVPGPKDSYYYELYSPEKHSLEKGQVTHLRSDGILALVETILHDAQKERSH